MDVSSLLMQVVEFKVGDVVTFQPYEKKFKAKVLEVLTEEKHLNGEYRNEIFYKLTGHGKHKVLCECSGASIFNSRYYIPLDKDGNKL